MEGEVGCCGEGVPREGGDEGSPFSDGTSGKADELPEVSRSGVENAMERTNSSKRRSSKPKANELAAPEVVVSPKRSIRATQTAPVAEVMPEAKGKPTQVPAAISDGPLDSAEQIPGVESTPATEVSEWINRRATAQATRAANARQVSGRRRFVDPTTCERDYSLAEMEFMQAMHDYKQRSGRMFPTWSEVLEVLKSLGYEKTVTMSELEIGADLHAAQTA